MFRSHRFFSVFLSAVLLLLMSGCAVYNDISVDKVDGFKLRGIQKNSVHFNLDLVVDNPNTQKIRVTKMEFKAWLNDRELGDIILKEPIKLTPCSRKTYTVPVELNLVSVADVFKLANPAGLETLSDRIEVEGKIRGKSCPIQKTIRVKRQPLKNVIEML